MTLFKKMHIILTCWSPLPSEWIKLYQKHMPNYITHWNIKDIRLRFQWWYICNNILDLHNSPVDCLLIWRVYSDLSVVSTCVHYRQKTMFLINISKLLILKGITFAYIIIISSACNFHIFKHWQRPPDNFTRNISMDF